MSILMMNSNRYTVINDIYSNYGPQITCIIFLLSNILSAEEVERKLKDSLQKMCRFCETN